MVFEGRIAEMLQNQASRFLRGFSGEQLRLGLLSGRIELHSLALNPEPLDSLLMESQIPLMLKAGVLMSAVVQLSIMQGELELVIDGLTLVLSPVCRWLTKEEVFGLRVNEIQRLEFVHMRSQCQRRTLEREMFRQLFGDYLSRLKITMRNVHVRVEIEGELGTVGRGGDAVFGMIMGSTNIIPLKNAVATQEKDVGQSQAGELLLSERINVKALSFYYESPRNAKIHISDEIYRRTQKHPMGVFGTVKQEVFVRGMVESQKFHASVPHWDQLMPPTGFAIGVDLRSQSVRDGFSVDGCLTMEVTMKLDGGPSRIHCSLGTLEHLHWLCQRAFDFDLWQYLHPLSGPPRGSRQRWIRLRDFVRLKRRIHSNAYSLVEAIQMRVHCKEYIRLYKKKFNGPASVVSWRKNMPSLTDSDAVRLGDLELVYPADKLVNFRLMAHAELKTEMALNSFLNADEGGYGDGLGQSPYRRAARELTPLEQLHLHGQHGYGVNIYRGLPPPPSSLKIRIDMMSSEGLWWICSLHSDISHSALREAERRSNQRKGHSARSNSKQAPASHGNDNMVQNSWAVALDCTAQPIRLLLVDSVVDASVFATVEVPAVSAGQRPLALLLGRSSAAFAHGSPGRSGHGDNPVCGGKGLAEWYSLLEVEGTVYVCSQLKTVLTSSPNSPWDIFMHVSCGETVDVAALRAAAASGFSKMTPMDAFGAGMMSVGQQPGQSATACLKLRVPLLMASGQPGPFVEMLRRCMSCVRDPVSQQVHTGAAHSALGWLARRISGTYDVAMLRLHFRLPPILVEGDFTGMSPIRFPRFDAAAHFEHGGLADGFVVGLHHLRYFTACLLSGGGARPSGRASNRNNGSNSSRRPLAPLSLEPLESAPPLSLLVSSILVAVAIAANSRTQLGRHMTGLNQKPPSAVLVELIKSLHINGLLYHEWGPAAADPESPAASVTFMIVVMAITVGRRLLWDLRDSRLQGRSNLPASSMEVQAATAAVTDTHALFAEVMRVVLYMGFPLHPRCMPLAAWAGARELLEVSSMSLPEGAPWPPHGLLIWAVRGAYANLQSRQEEVVRWLINQGARLDEWDKGERTLLDWACWGGAEELVMLALRAGLLPSMALRTITWPTESSASPPNSPAHNANKVAQQQKYNQQQLRLRQLALPPPSALTLAVAGRNPQIVALLLRAASDPHATMTRNTEEGAIGYMSGPLLLAVRNCEFEIGCEVLRGSPFVNVDIALGASQTAASSHGIPTQSTANVPGAGYVKGDDGLASSGSTVRATVAIVDSLRRFAGALSRRSDDGFYGYGYSGNAGSYGGGGGLQAYSHPPGTHPDDGLFAVGQLPFSDILHPLVGHLPLPVHKVGYDCRPHQPPHRWLRQSNGSGNGSSAGGWGPAHLFVECCLSRGFRPDAAVLARAMPALPTEARRIAQHLFRATPIPAGIGDLPTSNGLNYEKPGHLADNSNGMYGGGGQYHAGGADTDDISAAISFAKEIQHLRNRPNSGEGVPPIDIAAALGVKASPLSPSKDEPPGRQRAGMQKENAPKNAATSRQQVQQYRLTALPGPPSLWLAVGLGGPAPVAGPVSLETLCVDAKSVVWSISGSRVPGIHSGISLKDVSTIRRFELAGVGANGGRYVVEIKLKPEATATSIAEGITSGHGQHKAQMANGHAEPFMNGGSPNGHSQTSRHSLSLSFMRIEQANEFATMLRSHLQNFEEDAPSEQDDAATVEQANQFLASGPWDAAPLRIAMSRCQNGMSVAEVGGQGHAVAPSRLPPQTSAPLGVRVVVLGAPSVGKTTAAKRIRSELSATDTTNGFGVEADSAWLSVSSGLWPQTGKCRAEVYVWDTCSVALPSLIQRIVCDPVVPLLMVVVVDAAVSRIGAPADTLVAACIGEATAAAPAPRRLLVVENIFFGQTLGTLGQPVHARHHVLRANLASVDQSKEFGKAFSSVLNTLIGEVDSRGVGRMNKPPLPLGDYGPWSAVITARPFLASRGAAFDPKGDRALAAYIGGDSALLHPSAVAWAWSAIRAVKVGLMDNNDVSACGGAVMPWEKLERVLHTAEVSAGASVGHLLLRTLSDLGLVCPIPAFITTTVSDHKRISLGSNRILVPDFAKRLRLTPSIAAQLSCASSQPDEKHLNGPGEGSQSLSVRFIWDAAGGATPQLRTVLRNFIGRGVLGSFHAGGSPHCIEIKQFVLLEEGPTGAASAVTEDSLAPGFLLAFDLVPAFMPHLATSDVQESSNGCAVPKPPTSVQHATPSGAINDALKSNVDEVFGGDELGAIGVSSQLTTVIVGASSNCARCGGFRTNDRSSPPFWDVYCDGPHSQWALRALLGTGATSPSFAGFRKVGYSPSSAHGDHDPSVSWPLPHPICTISTMPATSQRASHEDSPTGAEFVGYSWLFNGPNAASARSCFLPPGQLSPSDQTGVAACCALLCGKKAPEAEEVYSGLNEDGDVRGLTSLADFEASLLARSWHNGMPRLLDDALEGGIEAWTLCATALARAAHDAAAAVAGVRGRALPLIQVEPLGTGGTLGSSAEPGSAQSSVVTLVPEGAEPLLIGTALAPASSSDPLGTIRLSSGVQAWLRLCRPAALWSVAGSSRGFLATANEPSVGSGSGLPSPRGAQVVDALKVAFATQFTEQMVLEVWDALSDLENARTLIRRACGTWARVASDSGGFVL